MPRQAVLFLIDTQGTFVLGSYTGNAALGTPHLDRLAAEGVRIDRAYTCSPVCGPARSAIFTGLPPHASGVLGKDMAPALNCPTVAQRLAPSGLACACIGKWHLDGSDYFGDGRCAPGWEPRWWFDGRWKLAVNLIDTDELYDLANDPQELINRIDDPAAATARDALHDVLLAPMGETRDPMRGPHLGRRPWRDLGGSTRGGPTRPRPHDPAFYPPTLLYDTGEPTEKPVYPKG